MVIRRQFVSIAGVALALPHAVRAQQAPTIGFLYPGVASAMPSRIAAIRNGLRDGGYRDADKVEILGRSADGDPARLPPLAADLVQGKVDVLVPVSASGLRAATAASTSIPIVAHNLEADPVASGYVASLARPGGNITGMFADFPDLGTKWLQLLKEAIPTLSNVVVFRDPTTSPPQMNAVEAAARLLNVKLQVIEVPSVGDVERTFAAAQQSRPDAAIALASPIFGTNPKLIADQALAHRLAMASLFPDIARYGGLVSYGPDILGTFRQLGTMVAKVLHGTRPAELPVERPTKFEMVLNLRTAKALGLTLPPLLVQRADEVIE
jgi:putative tryptophan/tyrosine transport system substrate-binding protein